MLGLSLWMREEEPLTSAPIRQQETLKVISRRYVDLSVSGIGLSILLTLMRGSVGHFAGSVLVTLKAEEYISSMSSFTAL